MSTEFPEGPQEPALHVFVLEASEHDALNAALKLIERAGFDVLDRFTAELPQSGHVLMYGVDVVRELRSGAAAQHVIVAVDLCPWSEEPGNGVRNTAFENQRLTRRLRELNASIASRLGCPEADRRLLSATPTSETGWRILRDLAPHKVSLYQQEIADRQSQMLVPFPCLREVTGYGNSARTYLVHHENQVRICKVFRPGRTVHLENELRGLSLAGAVPGIPKCVDAQRNWVLIEYFPDGEPLSSFANRFGLIPVTLAKKAFEVLLAIHEAGYAHLDFRPEHVLVQPDGAVVIIDFDRMHAYDTIPPFEESPPIVGCHGELALEAPNGPPVTYSSVWEPCIGLDFRSFISGSTLAQHAKRIRFVFRENRVSEAWKVGRR